MFKVIYKKHEIPQDQPEHWDICYDDCTQPHVTVWSNEISARLICDYLNSTRSL